MIGFNSISCTYLGPSYSQSKQVNSSDVNDVCLEAAVLDSRKDYFLKC